MKVLNAEYNFENLSYEKFKMIVSDKKKELLMKRILVAVILFLLVLVPLTSCRGDSYSFNEPIDEIESIEIVSAKNSLEFTVLKTLSEAEKENFLKEFQKIKFSNYYIGDPMSVYGNAVKIVYKNGDYEMICSDWSEYVKDGTIHFLFKYCDEEDFNKLLDKFWNMDKA